MQTINTAEAIKSLTDLGLSLDKATEMVMLQLTKMDQGAQSSRQPIKSKVTASTTTVKLDTREDLEAVAATVGHEFTTPFKLFTPEKGANAFKTGLSSGDGFPSTFSVYITGVDGTATINTLLEAKDRAMRNKEKLVNALAIAEDACTFLDKLSMEMFKNPTLEVKSFIPKK